MPSLSGMTTMLTPFHRYAASGVAFHKRRLEAPVDPFMVQVSLVSKDSTCMANEFKGYPNFRAKRRHHTRRKGTTLLLPSPPARQLFKGLESVDISMADQSLLAHGELDIGGLDRILDNMNGHDDVFIDDNSNGTFRPRRVGFMH